MLYSLFMGIIVKGFLLFDNLLLLILNRGNAILIQDAVVQTYCLSDNAFDVIKG